MMNRNQTFTSVDRRNYGLLLTVALAILPSAASCKKSSSSTDEAAADKPTLSPLETVKRAHELRNAGDLSRLEPFLLPDHREQVIKLLTAVDAILATNRALQLAVSRKMGPSAASLFERQEMANILGVFSSNVTVRDERQTGDTAVVTIQVAEQPAQEEVSLVLHEGRWVIKTDAPIVGMAEEFHNLAEVNRGLAREVEEEGMTLDTLKEQLRQRRIPILRRLADMFRQTHLPPP